MGWLEALGIVVILFIGAVIYGVKYGSEEEIDFDFQQLRYYVNNPRPTYKVTSLGDKETRRSLKQYQLEKIKMLEEIFESVNSTGLIPRKYLYEHWLSGDTPKDYYHSFSYGPLSHMKTDFDFDKNKKQTDAIIARLDDRCFILSKKIRGYEEKDKLDS